jgi:hypothetical protein
MQLRRLAMHMIVVNRRSHSERVVSEMAMFRHLLDLKCDAIGGEDCTSNVVRRGVALVNVGANRVQSKSSSSCFRDAVQFNFKLRCERFANLNPAIFRRLRETH